MAAGDRGAGAMATSYTAPTTYRPPTTTFGSYNPTSFGLAGAGYTAPRATTPLPTTAATAPAQTYAQRIAQQYGMGGAASPTTQTGYNYNPTGYGLAGAGMQWGQQQPAAASTPKPAPTAAPAPGTPSTPGATSSTNPGGQYINGQWVPSITQTTTLSPTEQALLDQQQALQKQFGTLGATLAGNVPTSPMSFAGAPAMPTEGQYNTEAANAVYQQQTAMLDPQWQQQETQLRDQLRDQGIPEGSDAFNQAMTLFQNQKTTAYQQAKDASIQEGYNVSNQQFQQGMAARQQGVSEAQNLYTQPASTLAQLMGAYQGTGGIQAPQANYTPAQIAPTNLAGTVQTATGQQLGAYGQQMQYQGANMGNLSGLAGMLAMGLMA